MVYLWIELLCMENFIVFFPYINLIQQIQTITEFIYNRRVIEQHSKSRWGSIQFVCVVFLHLLSNGQAEQEKKETFIFTLS
jgi:hypothetical protein